MITSRNFWDERNGGKNVGKLQNTNPWNCKDKIMYSLLTQDQNLIKNSSLPSGYISPDASSTGDVDELMEKYERLADAHKKLQEINIGLEEKLLKLVEKHESEKNIITRDLVTQTQALVAGKLTIEQVHKQNTQLKADLQVALGLLQTKPNNFMCQKISSLPEEIQSELTKTGKDKVEKCWGGQKIKVSVSRNDSVSAAVLAKVLEEREKARNFRKEQKFCIDVGTQTYRWEFPGKREILGLDEMGNSTLELDANMSALETLEYLPSDSDSTASQGTSLEDKSCYESEDDQDVCEQSDDFEDELEPDHVSNILLSSIIHSPPVEDDGKEDKEGKSKFFENMGNAFGKDNDISAFMFDDNISGLVPEKAKDSNNNKDAKVEEENQLETDIMQKSIMSMSETESDPASGSLNIHSVMSLTKKACITRISSFSGLQTDV